MNNSKQQQLSLMGGLDPIADAPTDAVMRCDTYLDAVRLCIHMDRSRRTQSEFAALCGMSAARFSGILNQSGKQKRHLDPGLFNVIQEHAGNRAIAQFFDLESRRGLMRQGKQSRRQQLLRELAELEAAG